MGMTAMDYFHKVESVSMITVLCKGLQNSLKVQSQEIWSNDPFWKVLTRETSLIMLRP